MNKKIAKTKNKIGEAPNTSPRHTISKNTHNLAWFVTLKSNNYIGDGTPAYSSLDTSAGDQ